MLRFLLQFFKIIHVHAPTDILVELIVIFPTSLYMLRKCLALDRNNFTKYVVCPKCTKRYEYNQCVTEVNGHHVIKRRNNMFYSRGKVNLRNGPLVKKVTLKNNTVKYYPIFYYCYTGIINSIENIVKKQEFPEKCEEWWSQGFMDSEFLTYIYSGK